MLIVKAAPGVPFSIGRQGEHKVRTVVFELSDWVKALGDGRAEVLFQRPRDSAPYPVPVEQDGGLVTWLVTKTDTDQPTRSPAFAKCEVRWYLEDALAKSEICAVSCYPALDAPGEIPDPPGQSWLDQALEAGVQAQEAAQRAENAAVHQPIIQDGTWWVWNPLTGVYEDTGTSASGSGSSSNAVQYVEQALTKDQKTQARQNIGAASSEEVSKLSAEKLDKTALPTAINDALAQAKASGEFDGAPGEDGKDGSPGKDGTSVTHKWNGTVLEITSASGTSSADLKGEPGQDGKDGAQGPAGAGLDVTGATVGQIVQIAAVDASGKPTEWTSADMPSGNGYEVEQLVMHTVTEEEAATAVYLNFDLPKNYQEYIVLYYAAPSTVAINGAIAFNDSPWTSGNRISGNIGSKTTGYCNATIRFAVDGDGAIIPVSGYQAQNITASSNVGFNWQNYIPVMMTTTANANPVLETLSKNRTSIAIGSYNTGWLGAGSIFAVYGIGGYEFVEEDA